MSAFCQYHCLKLLYDFTVNTGSCCSVIQSDFHQLTEYQPWQFGLVENVIGCISEADQQRAQLVLGWVIFGKWVKHVGM